MEFLDRADLGSISSIEDKTFFDLAYDSIFNVWYGDCSWTNPIWTLSLEMIATFMVYLIA